MAIHLLFLRELATSRTVSISFGHLVFIKSSTLCDDTEAPLADKMNTESASGSSSVALLTISQSLLSAPRLSVNELGGRVISVLCVPDEVVMA